MKKIKIVGIIPAHLDSIRFHKKVIQHIYELPMIEHVRRRAKLYNQDQSASIFAWPRDYVKTHTPDDVTVKKQKIIAASGGKVTVTTDSNEAFLQLSRDNFQLSVYDLNGATGGGANTFAWNFCRYLNRKKITSLLVVSDRDLTKKNQVLKGIIHIHILLQNGIK